MKKQIDVSRDTTGSKPRVCSLSPPLRAALLSWKMKRQKASKKKKFTAGGAEGLVFSYPDGFDYFSAATGRMAKNNGYRW